MPEVSLPPFTLYGVFGCPHCEAAEKFLKVRNVAYVGMWANGDPIIEAGAKAILGKLQVEYPLLVSRVEGKPKIIKGFRKEAYERLVQLLYASAEPNVPSIFGSGQQPVKQTPTEVDDLTAEDDGEVTVEDDEPNPTTRTGVSKKGPKPITN